MAQDEQSVGGFSATLGLDDQLTPEVDKALGGVEKKFTGSFQRINTVVKVAVASAGAAVLGVGVAAVKVADTVDKESKRLAAAMGRPAEEAEKFRRIVRDVYLNSAVNSFEEAGQAIQAVEEKLAKFGVTGEQEVARVTTGVVALERTFKADFGATTEAVAALMRNFGLSSEQALDFVTKGFQRGLNASGDFLQSVATYASAFKEGGASAEQFFSGLETGMAEGRAGTKALGILFREFVNNAKQGNNEVYASVQLLSQATGRDLVTAYGQFINGQMTSIELLALLKTALADVNDSVLRNQIGVALFGQAWEAMGEKAILAIDLSKTKMNELKGANESLQKQFETIGEAWDYVKKRGVLALEDIGKAMLPILKDRIPSIEKALDGLAEKGPAIGKIFASGLDFALKVLVPVLDTLVSIVSHSPGFVQAIASVGLGLVAWTSIGGPVLNLVKLFQGFFGAGKLAVTGIRGVATALGVVEKAAPAAGGAFRVMETGALAATGGVAALQAALLVFTVAVAVNEIAKLVSAWQKLKEQHEEIQSIDEQNASHMIKNAEYMQQAGVAIDMVALKKMSLAEAEKYLDQVFRENIATIDAYTASQEKAATASSENAKQTDYLRQLLVDTGIPLKGYTAAVWEQSDAVDLLNGNHYELAAAARESTMQSYAAGDASYAAADANWAMSASMDNLTFMIDSLTKYINENSVAFDFNALQGKSLVQQINLMQAAIGKANTVVQESTDAATANADANSGMQDKVAVAATATDDVAAAARSATGALGQQEDATFGVEMSTDRANDAVSKSLGLLGELTGGYGRAAGAAWDLANAQAAVANTAPQSGGGYRYGGVVPYANGGVVPKVSEPILKIQPLARGGKAMRAPVFSLVGEQGAELRSDLGGSHITPARATEEIFQAVADRFLDRVASRAQVATISHTTIRQGDVRVDARTMVTAPIMAPQPNETTDQFIRRYGPPLFEYVNRRITARWREKFGAKGLVIS